LAPFSLRRAKINEPVVLDASRSHDPDRGQWLHFHWFQYAGAGASLTEALTDVQITGADLPKATVTAAQTCRERWPTAPLNCGTGVAHVILEVTDDGTPRLTSYRRVIVRVTRDP
jgi:hypothetical protein